MITYYTEADLISFGQYLRSDERRERFAASQKSYIGFTLDERLSQVHDADLRNWIEKRQQEHWVSITG